MGEDCGEIYGSSVKMLDGYGNPIGSLKGAINIHDADVHTQVLNKSIHQHTATATTLTAATSADGLQYTIDVADATGFLVNDYIHVNTTSIEPTHPRILAITNPTGASTFTLDRRLDRAHNIGDEIRKSILDMSLQVGTLADPQIYFIGPPAGEVWHMKRFVFAMILGTAGDLGLFGNLAALTNGVLLRAKVNGNYGTFTNWKRNADMKSDMYDVEFDNRSGGQGNYGTSGRGTISESGGIIRLDGDTDDRIELWIQDDITDINSYTMKFQGHREDV